MWSLLILFANFQYTELNPKTTDVVFLNTIIFLMKAYFRGEEMQKELEAEKQKLKKGHLVVRAERKNILIPYEDLM